LVTSICLFSLALAYHNNRHTMRLSTVTIDIILRG